MSSVALCCPLIFSAFLCFSCSFLNFLPLWCSSVSRSRSFFSASPTFHYLLFLLFTFYFIIIYSIHFQFHLYCSLLISFIFSFVLCWQMLISLIRFVFHISFFHSLIPSFRLYVCTFIHLLCSIYSISIYFHVFSFRFRDIDLIALHSFILSILFNGLLLVHDLSHAIFTFSCRNSHFLSFHLSHFIFYIVYWFFSIFYSHLNPFFLAFPINSHARHVEN